MCGAFPPHCIFLVWCQESHSSILGHYIALTIILWKRWSNLLSLFMEITCLFSTLTLSTSDIIFKKNVVRHEIWLSWPFYYIPLSYHLSWYAGQFGCMDLTSWQIWNFYYAHSLSVNSIVVHDALADGFAGHWMVTKLYRCQDIFSLKSAGGEICT